MIKEKSIKSLRESHDYLENILVGVYSGIIILNKNDKIKKINPSAEKILNIKENEVTGKHYAISLPKNISDTIERLKPIVLNSNVPVEFEEEIKGRYDTNILIGGGIVKLKSAHTKKIIGMMIIFQDITYRRKITILEELNKIKSDFISTVSHEIRTPLTSIRGYSEIISDFKTSQEDVKKFAKIIKHETERLTRLIDNYLNLSKIEFGKFELKKELFDIKEVIESRINLFQAETQTHTITSNIQENLPPIWADKDKITQVLNNLLSNAIKYSPDGGDINITIKTTDNDRFLEVCISDEGLGISEEDISFIFEQFKRIDMTKKIIEGTGLGLAISKHIINSHDGEIWVESKQGLGSKFYFRIPIEKPEIKKILIVDDDKSLVDIITCGLEIKGFKVISACNGKKCMEKLKEEKISLLILDIKLPDKDGYEVIEEIRKDKKLKDIPVILISGAEQPDTKRLEELGVKEFLAKPFSCGVLNSVIEKNLEEMSK